MLNQLLIQEKIEIKTTGTKIQETKNSISFYGEKVIQNQ